MIYADYSIAFRSRRDAYSRIFRRTKADFANAAIIARAALDVGHRPYIAFGPPRKPESHDDVGSNFVWEMSVRLFYNGQYVGG
jgi:hypothetical protein